MGGVTIQREGIFERQSPNPVALHFFRFNHSNSIVPLQAMKTTQFVLLFALFIGGSKCSSIRSVDQDQRVLQNGNGSSNVAITVIAITVVAVAIMK
jgi:hypothetical protein